MRLTKQVGTLLLLFTLSLPAWPQFGRDPLSSKEVNELREARQDPEKRLKLYVQYARQRMDSIERLRTDPRLTADRATKTHDLLEDLSKLVEEMDDNVDMYAKDKFDIRKPLKDVVAANAEFQQKLNALRDVANSDSALGEEVRKNYKFVLDDTIEAVNSCLDSARETLQEQETIARDKNRKQELRKAEPPQ